MRFVKAFLIVLSLLLLIAAVGTYLVLRNSAPSYSGTLAVSGIESDVKVTHDPFGIPHIQASNTEDAFFALGYLHAGERLFQMELLRRAGSGRLAELLGPDLIEADRLFCSIGFREYSAAGAKLLVEEGDSSTLAEVNAYLNGVNFFILNQPPPPEFTLLGAEPSPYEMKDLFAISNYMAFSFALGQRTEPLVEWIRGNLGEAYLEHTALFHYEAEPVIPVHRQGTDSVDYSSISTSIGSILDQIPLSAFQGSNSWAVSGSRTQSGKPILCNDTHMKHAMPSVWFEARIESPGLNLYGNYIPGIPYPLIAHSDRHAWGMTMLEQDDMDFYWERSEDGGATMLYRNKPIPFRTRSYLLQVKGLDAVTHEVKDTPHGPIVNELFQLDSLSPVSMWWDFTRHPNRLLQAFRGLSRAKDIRSFEQSVAKIHGPGLNVQYADAEGNIAWWAAAKLLRRPKHVNSKAFMDGASGNDEALGYYPFEENPRSVNPASGIISSANQQPGPMPDSSYYPGYYKPHHRGERINRELKKRNDWHTEAMKLLINDVVSDEDAALFESLKTSITADVLSSNAREWIEQTKWNGSHDLEQTVPSVYYKWLYHILSGAMQDEMGTERFQALLSTHWVQRTYLVLLRSPQSPWWDDIRTPQSESLNDVVTQAFAKTFSELEQQFGEDPAQWTWRESRELLIEHPMGKVKPLNLLFNVGPGKIPGGYETISQTYFKLDSSGYYPVIVGPQMRIVHDLADPANSWSIHPAGQSGHPLSKHYSDQFSMYLEGEFRLQSWKASEHEEVLLFQARE